MSTDIVLREPAKELLDILTPDTQSPMWTKIPSMSEALKAFTDKRRSTIVQLNGKRLNNDRITDDGKWRCWRVAYALASGELPIENTWIFCSGGKGQGQYTEGEVFQRYLLDCLDIFNVVLPDNRIRVEGQARFTHENAGNVVKLVEESLDGSVPKALRIPPPGDVCMASTDWHCDRQNLTHTIVPERSEFSLWYRKFPGILSIRPLKAPYPPWRSTNVQVRWMARAHVATHGFTPLEIFLQAIADGDGVIKEFREEALIVYGASLVELYYCLRDIPKQGTKAMEVAQIVRVLEDKRSWENESRKTATLWERCCDFYDELQQFCGTTLGSLSNSALQVWKARGETLRNFRKELRYITDPDYR